MSTNAVEQKSSSRNFGVGEKFTDREIFLLNLNYDISLPITFLKIDP